ncbi:MAG: divergent polysaccharide deacetylase family protein [Pseudomonadales bacterium]
MPSRIEVFARLIKYCLPGALVLACSLGAAADTTNNLAPSARIAIILDDIGNNLPLGRRAVQLPGAITYAVLPHTPLASRLAREALLDNTAKEIVVHMPMQAVSGNRLGPGGLRATQPREDFQATVRAALDAIPAARGLSNHMGSYLTTLPDRMQWLMEELQRNNLYYVDNKTARNNKAGAAARSQQVPYIARDIFLDHDPRPEAIEAAFDRAVRVARQRGVAVVIAHPYRNTLDFLENRLPLLQAEGVALVNASAALVVREHSRQLALRKR